MKRLAMTALALVFLLGVSVPAMGCGLGMAAACGGSLPCSSPSRPCAILVKGEAHPALPPEPQARFAARARTFHDQITHLPETPPPRRSPSVIPG